VGEFNIDYYIILTIIISNLLSYLHYSLNNVKNDCAKNVIFQLLCHTPPIRNTIHQNYDVGTLTPALHTLFTKMEESKTSFYTPLSNFLYTIQSNSNTDNSQLTEIYNYNKLFSVNQGMSKLIVAIMSLVMVELSICTCQHYNLLIHILYQL